MLKSNATDLEKESCRNHCIGLIINIGDNLRKVESNNPTPRTYELAHKVDDLREAQATRDSSTSVR